MVRHAAHMHAPVLKETKINLGQVGSAVDRCIKGGFRQQSKCSEHTGLVGILVLNTNMAAILVAFLWISCDRP